MRRNGSFAAVRGLVGIVASAALACSLTPVAWAGQAGHGADAPAIERGGVADPAVAQTAGKKAASSVARTASHVETIAVYEGDDTEYENSVGHIECTLDRKAFAYTGESIKPVPSLRYVGNDEDADSTDLIAETDYTLTYMCYEDPDTGDEEWVEADEQDCVEPGEYRIYISTTYNLPEGSNYISYYIYPVDSLYVADVEIGGLKFDQEREYYMACAGVTKDADVTVRVVSKGTTLTKDTDYEVSFGDGDDANWSPTLPTESGDYQIRIVDKREDSDSAERYFTLQVVDPTSLDARPDDGVWLDTSAYRWTGDPVVLDLRVSDEYVGKLTAGTDYTLEYKGAEGETLSGAPSGAGDYTVVVKGIGWYTGTLEFPFRIVEVADGEKHLAFARTPSLVHLVYDEDGEVVDWNEVEQLVSTDTLEDVTVSLYYENEDEALVRVLFDAYEVEFQGPDGQKVEDPSSGLSVGTYHAVVMAKPGSGYTGDYRFAFDVGDGYDLQNASYDGNTILTRKGAQNWEPELYIGSKRVNLDNCQLIFTAYDDESETNETIDFSDDQTGFKGECTCVVSPKDGSNTYKGSYSIDVTIVADGDLSAATFELPRDVVALEPDASAVPEVVVKLDGEKVDKNGYSLQYRVYDEDDEDGEIETSSDAPSSVGEYEVRAVGEGSYSGATKWAWFEVVAPKTLVKGSDDVFLNKGAYKWTGQSVELELQVRCDDEYVDENDYQLSYYTAGSGDALSGAPSEPGDYKVTVSGAEGSIYRGEVSFPFSIIKQEEGGPVNIALSDEAMLSHFYRDAGGELSWDGDAGMLFTTDTLDGLGLVIYFYENEGEEEGVVNRVPFDAYEVEFQDLDGKKVEDFSQAGTYCAVATAKPGSGYTGVCTCYFDVYDAYDLSRAYVDTGASDILTAAGARSMKPVVRMGDAVVPASAYTLAIEYCVYDQDADEERYVPVSGYSEPGNYRLVVQAKKGSRYTGETTFDLRIVADTDLRASEFSLPDGSRFIRTGEPIEIEASVTIDGKRLVQGKDYRLEFSTNNDDDDDEVTLDAAPIEAGHYSVRAVGIGSYTGESSSFGIEIVGNTNLLGARATLSGVQLSDFPGDAPEVAYTGSRLVPSVTLGSSAVVDREGCTFEVYKVDGTDYDDLVEVEEGILAPGLYMLLVEPDESGLYEGDASFEDCSYLGYVRVVSDLAKASVSVANQTYSGRDLKPVPTVRFGGRTLVAGTDYKASYAANRNAGTATVTIEGLGVYTGKTTARFSIAKSGQPGFKLKKASASYKAKKLKKKGKSMKIAPVGGQGTVKYTLDKKAKKSKKIKVAANGKVTIKKGLKKGTYKISVRASGNANYNASAVKTFTIKVK